jgi:beta-lactamase regulating signal transducer with metallopeptidase domain
MQFRQLASFARPAPAEWQTLSQRLAAELSLRRAPEILVVPGRLPPLVVPGRRPRVLVPMALIDRLDESERTVLLLHEMAHVRRGDHLARIVELLVGVVYWWLPGLSLLGRQLRACEETCCDATVLSQFPDARREYARLLLDVLDFTDPLPGDTMPQATAMSTKGLEQRLRAILDGGVPPRRIWPVALLAAVLACAVLPCEIRYAVARPTAAPAAAPAQRPQEDKCTPSLCCPRESKPPAPSCCGS